MGRRLTRQYDVAFRLGAVELVEQKGCSVPVAAESLGVAKSNLYTWRRQYQEGRLAPGHKPGSADAERGRVEAAARREQAAETSKKASATFAKQPG